MSRTRSRSAQLFVIGSLAILSVLTLLPFVMTLLMSQKTNGERQFAKAATALPPVRLNFISRDLSKKDKHRTEEPNSPY